MTVPITKWNYQITDATEIPAIFAKAFHIATTGRPGPVVLDITKDAQFGNLDFHYEPYQPKLKNELIPIPNETELQEAADRINHAQRPYLLLGHGVLISQAEELLRQFVEKTGIPVASTLLGLSAMPTSHPLYVGMLGMHGNYGANVLSDEADVVIAIGMRFDDRVTGDVTRYLPDATIIHIDIDQAEFDKNMKVDIKIQADAKYALQHLMPLVERRNHSAWLERFKAHNRLEQDQVMNPEMYPKDGKIRMAEVVCQLSQQTRGEAILVTDVGQHQMIAARYYQFNRPHSHITSGGLGTMGFALPAGVGAKFAAQARDVVVIAGDGGFQMNIQALGMIAQEGLSIKILVLNNNYLGMVRQWQEMFFASRYSFTEMHNPDFVTVAKGYGIVGEKVAQRNQLVAALSKMLQAKGPYLLEVIVEKEENVFPMVPSGAAVSEMRLS